MTALFDRYLAVDWSAANTPSRGRDSVWIALAERDGRDVSLLDVSNPATRSEAMAMVEAVFSASLAEGKRVFAGFDFPMGYPAGAAAAIAGEPNWRALWTRLAELIHDRDDNVSNRFEIAGRLNRDVFGASPMYWGRPDHLRIPGLEMTRPAKTAESLAEYRLAESRARPAQPVWKLAFAGSVGSQALIGMARLARLLESPTLADHLRVWPFETGFDADLSAPLIIAEMYPGLLSIDQADKSCRDEAEVTAMAEMFGRLDAAGRLSTLLAAPDDLSAEERALVLAEEGWIVGVGRAIAEEAAAAPSPIRKLAFLGDSNAVREETARVIATETDLSSVPEEARRLVTDLVEACAMTDIVPDLVISPEAIVAGRQALESGAPVLCDSEMVAQGIDRAALRAGNKVICRLGHPQAGTAAERQQISRAAAQVDLWDDLLPGAVVALGSDPATLFRLLERLDEGAPRPALILAFPVALAGAAEAKAELVENPRGIPFITLAGRRGGAPLAVAAIEALATSED
ncbi:precorrin-8X methylmutase [Consotaella salsifontis]|uniref:Precorrin-8X methylmutase n=2 Tax=Consotaella salsifontis TaxID=1365950 RepID=A0A1T4QUC7_9HYPH|nr:precorrin-8X methylmutase [Consotaella salsifontis]